jgi:hypothetical protein
MFLPKPDQGFAGDDVHPKSISQIEIFFKLFLHPRFGVCEDAWGESNACRNGEAVRGGVSKRIEKNRQVNPKDLLYTIVMMQVCRAN